MLSKLYPANFDQVTFFSYMSIVHYDKLQSRQDVDSKEARKISTGLANISMKKAIYLVPTLSPMIESLAKYQHQMGLFLLFIPFLTTVNLFCLI